MLHITVKSHTSFHLQNERKQSLDEAEAQNANKPMFVKGRLVQKLLSRHI